MRGKWRTRTHSKRPTGKKLEPSSLLLCGDGVNRCTTVSAFPPILIPLYKSFPSPFLCLHTNKDCHCSADQWKHNRDLLSCSRADLLTGGSGRVEVGGGNVPLVVDAKIRCSWLVTGQKTDFGLSAFLYFFLQGLSPRDIPATSNPVNG